MVQYLGQHFLTNRSAINKIVTALALAPGEVVIEIGPGKGALTLPLTNHCRATSCRVIGIERDPRLAGALERKLGENPSVSIIVGDIIKKLPVLTASLSSYKLVGNIPYYLTGKLLRLLSEADRQPDTTVLTIQREVAERLTASPPRMNLLSAMVHIWSEAKIVMMLRPSDFTPPPKVSSAIVFLKKSPRLPKQEFAAYTRLVRTVFKQPRKTLANNLSAAGVPKELLQRTLSAFLLTGRERPQDLSLEMLISLSRHFG